MYGWKATGNITAETILTPDKTVPGQSPDITKITETGNGEPPKKAITGFQENGTIIQIDQEDENHHWSNRRKTKSEHQYPDSFAIR